MLSCINLSVQERKKTVIDNLQAVFHEGFVYGLYAADAGQLRPLLECISGQRTSWQGDMVYNKGSLSNQVAYIECGAAAARQPGRTPKPALQLAGAGFEGVEPLPRGSTPAAIAPALDLAAFPQKIILLQDLRTPQVTIPGEKIVVITSNHYMTLRATCDFIYLFDRKRFPIVVEKANFAMFDGYFEHVFRL